MIGIIIFAVIFTCSALFAYKKFSALRRNILLGKEEEQKGDASERWKNVLLIAFGQKKMFARIIPAIMHLFIYVAFVVTQVELAEIIVDGLTGSHRFFASFLGVFYTFLISSIEIMSVLAFIATFVFLARRNLLKLPRFVKSELNGWPRLDANLILFAEIALIVFIFMMNGADSVLQLDRETAPSGLFAISSWLGPILFGGITNTHTLHIIESIGWWGHVLMVFAFLNYLPYSKHLHIMLAFPGVYYAKLQPKGEIDNMPEVQKMVDPNADFSNGGAEVAMPKFGAADVFDLSWRTILQAYSCTECGRCTSVCPANLTGKELSPRKIVMNVRDRAEEIGKNLDLNKTEFITEDQKDKTSRLTKENYADGRNLFDYISEEELRACTTCNACVEACPILINPLEIIVEMRRNLILEHSKSPESWNTMFTSMENNGAPWAFSAADRDKWTTEM